MASAVALSSEHAAPVRITQIARRHLTPAACGLVGMTSSRCQPPQASIAHAVAPPTDELMSTGAPASLRDGSRVRIRQGRRSDGELLLRAFDDLSRESRYRRFLAPLGALSEGLLRYLTEVPMPPARTPSALGELLRVTALHDVVVPRAIEPPRQALAKTRKCPAELAPVSQ